MTKLALILHLMKTTTMTLLCLKMTTSELAKDVQEIVLSMLTSEGALRMMASPAMTISLTRRHRFLPTTASMQELDRATWPDHGCRGLNRGGEEGAEAVAAVAAVED
jgi:hypothetical protein